MNAQRARRVRPHLVWWGLAALPLTFLAFFFLWPLATVLWRGLTADGSLRLDLVAESLTDSHTLKAIGTTLGLAIAGTAGSVALGIPAAYALFHLQWRGVALARAAASVPFVLPTVVVAAAFSALVRRGGPLGWTGLDQSLWIIVAALVFYNTSVIMRVVGGAWAGLDPSRIAAARTLGASRLAAFRHVTLPALAPALASAASLAFLFCASSFGIVLVLGGSRVSTIETEIYLQINQFLDLRTAALLSLVQLVIVAVTLRVSDRARRSRERSSPSRRLDGTRRATRRDVPAIALALGALGLINGVPIVALVERSLRTASGYSLQYYRALGEEPARALLPESVLMAAWHSVTVAAAATVISSVLGLIVAHLVTYRSRRSTAIDMLVAFPVGVSAVMIGLGLLLTMNRNVLGFDLRASWWLVPIGQSLVALPFVTRTLVPAARAIDDRLRSAAATLGASPAKVWALVDWPLLARPFGVAVGFAAAIALGEFGATAFLARPDAPTLPTAIVRLLGRPGADNVGMAFAAAVLLAAVTGTIMFAAERLRRVGEADL